MLWRKAISKKKKERKEAIENINVKKKKKKTKIDLHHLTDREFKKYTTCDNVVRLWVKSNLLSYLAASIKTF